MKGCLLTICTICLVLLVIFIVGPMLIAVLLAFMGLM